MKYTVYLRTNLVNGKQYVGQTKDLKKREWQWYNAKWGYAGRLINNARKKYGVENWETKILKECESLDETNFWETYYIKELGTKCPNGYNLTDGGDGSTGCVVSEETKKKISQATKGKNNPFYGKHHSKKTIQKLKNRVITNEWRKKISEAMKGRTPWMKGKHHTKEAKNKLSEERKGKHNSPETEFKKGQEPWNTGKHLSEETKKKISEALKNKKGHPMSEETKKKLAEVISKRKKQVYQCTLDYNLVKAWDSASSASKELGISRGAIKDCCHGGRFSVYNGEKKWYKITQYKGFKWMYKEDYEKMVGKTIIVSPTII